MNPVKYLGLYKAQPTLKALPIESIEIHIDQEVPDAKTLEDADNIYKNEAFLLCNALESTLPGGTFDHLLVEMLKRKASHFKVSHKE
jgi:hypothetical protein